MKKAAVISIIIYQNTIAVLFKQITGSNMLCRFSPSCSEYTKMCIELYGFKKGIKMGLIRLLNCHPFNHNYANI